MLKKTITYQDLDGNPITEDFWFHLSMAEVSKMELGTEGGFAEKLQALIKAANGKEIIEQFEAIILGAYGERSADNKSFIKNPQVREAFSQTDAYSVLFMELVADPGAATEFVKGILPREFEAAVAKMNADANAPVQSNVFQDNPSQPAQALPYSAVDIMNMSAEEFANLKAQSQK